MLKQKVSVPVYKLCRNPVILDLLRVQEKWATDFINKALASIDGGDATWYQVVKKNARQRLFSELIGPVLNDYDPLVCSVTLQASGDFYVFAWDSEQDKTMFMLKYA